MSSLLLQTIKRTFLVSVRRSNRRAIMHFQKWLQRMNAKKYHHSLLGLIPHATLLVPNISNKMNQYDVEENIGHLMTLARIALEKGEVEKAVAILEMGVKICEEYQSYYVMPYMYDVLASIAFALGDFNRAETLLVQVIEKMLQLGFPETNNQMVDFKLRLARIYSTHNEDFLAEIGFKTCLTQQQTRIIQNDTSPQTGMLYVNTLFWYGLHKIKQKDYTVAKNLIDSAYGYAMKIKGLSPYQEMIILSTLADLNLQLEDYDLALENLNSAIVLGKGIGSLDLPKCYIRLAKVYKKLDSIEAAKKWLKEAKDLAELFNDQGVLEEARRFTAEINNK